MSLVGDSIRDALRVLAVGDWGDVTIEDDPALLGPPRGVTSLFTSEPVSSLPPPDPGGGGDVVIPFKRAILKYQIIVKSFLNGNSFRF